MSLLYHFTSNLDLMAIHTFVIYNLKVCHDHHAQGHRYVDFDTTHTCFPQPNGVL